jgi:septum formation protein
MLRRLSGRSHTVFTGLALQRASTGYRVYEAVATTVFCRPLTDSIIEDYLARVHVLDKAGAYGIQEHGNLIVERYEGSYTNIVGLPIENTKQMFVSAGLLPP